ncbi:Chromatin structure-remodeling complex subunit arp9 [Hyphodiscus hymeniophilus]|uniref:Chromatin structure-remodeling complex subunit arp9 n=1 Tax=Hyphodiscus hymeniophilus TaxID=353542 RepID=A0A9P7AXZ0_9HELO|nr:Chromatin structure-remodeling complex subunit arp9 [Hyphodiscus hymeniophilus]
MDSSLNVDVRSGVTSIIHEFAEASEAFQKWRTRKAGKKAVGQQECETSLQEGRSTIEGSLDRFSLQHGARFNCGDSKDLTKPAGDFHEAVVEVLARCIAGKLSKMERIDPLVLRLTSESTRKATIVAMDELSRRIVSGTVAPYTMTSPGDVLPPMPLLIRPPRPPGAAVKLNQGSVVSSAHGSGGNDSSQTLLLNAQATQASSAAMAPGSIQPSQTLLEAPFCPLPQRNNVHIPASSWKVPDFGTSQALVRTRPSSSASALSWMKEFFPSKPVRPYYDIAPLKPTEAVLPTFKCDVDAMDILEEGRTAAEKLWDAADAVERDRLRLQSHSAPIPQGPWKSMFGDDDTDEETRTQTSFPQKREPPTPPEANDSQTFLKPVLPGDQRASRLQPGHSETILIDVPAQRYIYRPWHFGFLLEADYLTPPKMPPFKDEHILIIAPGSQTTLAQLGLPESFCPAQHRFPTRVFAAPDGKTFEPHKIRSRKKDAIANGGDVEMTDATDLEGNDDELIEDPEDLVGAIWPLKSGRIDNMPAFFAFLNHIFITLSPTLHTPVMLIAQPAWTAKNHEDITQFIFEKFKTPALCIMDAALATAYAYGIGAATIVDVGFGKVDVTAITDFQISSRGTVPNSGGEGMTQRLANLLKSKNFTRDMAEQLKRSAICEILSPGTPMPGTDAPEEVVTNPAAAASTGAISSGPSVRITEAPHVPGLDTEIGDEDDNLDKTVDDDGVLDVASIVASGKTQEFLAKKEKEKQEKAVARKAAKDAREAAEAAAAKPTRLPNSKRPRAIFHYEDAIGEAPSSKRQKTPEPISATAEEAPGLLLPEEPKPAEEALPPAVEVPAPLIDGPAALMEAPAAASEVPVAPIDASAAAAAPVEDEAGRREQQKAARKEEKRKAREEENPGRVRQDIEIGLERFQAAGDGFLDAIADTIYRTILSVDDISKRQDAWDALIICGLGAKLRGFKDALVTTLNNRYLVSPSSATMFMSELPSNLATPSGTGSMTPNASFSSTPHQPPTASAVNPLLLAATTASNPALNPNMSNSLYNGHPQTHSSHSQSPTSIKVASPPAYFPEWKSFDEAVFLGSQVAAKVIFVVDQGLSKGFLSRLEFNEEGPSAIHQM